MMSRVLLSLLVTFALQNVAVPAPVEDPLKDLDDKALLITLLSPNRTNNGDLLLEGDIAVRPEDGSVNIKALPNRGAIWRTRVIPYEFHDSVSDETQKVIGQAMDEWSSRTCVTFVPKKEDDKSYLRFRTDSPGCYTLVGKKHSGVQDVNLGEGCQHMQIATHEIGHSLGFYHEHSRKDRASHIRIQWQNIQRGMTSQFSTGNDDPRGVPYDVTSIMHYSPMSFSSRMFEKNTMVSINPYLQPLIGQYRGITFRDAKLANLIYKCDEKCVAKRGAESCQNEGYLAPVSSAGSQCKCVCPPNTKGEFCEILTGSYYGEKECGGDVTEETEIRSPGYPDARSPGVSCTWKIQAPRAKKACVEFTDFSIRPRMDKPGTKYHDLCVYEHVEVRKSDGDDGDMFCGQDIAPGTKMCSTSNVFWVIMRSDTRGIGKGFAATVTHQ